MVYRYATEEHMKPCNLTITMQTIQSLAIVTNKHTGNFSVYLHEVLLCILHACLIYKDNLCMSIFGAL